MEEEVIWIMQAFVVPGREHCCWCKGRMGIGTPIMIARTEVNVRMDAQVVVGQLDRQFHVACYNAMMKLYQRWKEARDRNNCTASYTVVDEGPVENGSGAPKSGLPVGKDILRAHDL